jgi:hypothetical protein
VSQNMYMKPSSSLGEMGFASSESRRAVICGEADFGIKERNSPVWESGSRSICGRWRGCFCGDFLGSFEYRSVGTDIVVRPLRALLASLGALFFSSASPMQQKKPELLVFFDFLLRLSECEVLPSVLCGFSISDPATGFRLCFSPFFCSTSSRFSRSINVSTLVRSLTLFDFPWGEAGKLAACCSLCCQQYESGLDIGGLTPLRGLGAGLDCVDLESGLRHGVPLAVKPLQVEAGFLESDLARSDSGVPGMKGMLGG